MQVYLFGIYDPLVKFGLIRLKELVDSPVGFETVVTTILDPRIRIRFVMILPSSKILFLISITPVKIFIIKLVPIGEQSW